MQTIIQDAQHQHITEGLEFQSPLSHSNTLAVDNEMASGIRNNTIIALG